MISKFSVKKPYTVLVGVVLVLVLGAVSLYKMTTDLLPNMNLPYALVITTYIGASPESVEKVVTAPVEGAMATTSNIKSIQSMSSNSLSMVILEYEQKANMDSVVIEMQQKLDQLKGAWPSAVGSPMIMQIDPTMLPIMVASADVEGMSQVEISDYVNNTLKPNLESVEGVATVSTTGNVTESIQVTLDDKKIEKINKDVLAKIEDKFVEAQEKIDDGKKELEDGEKTLEQKKKELADELANASNELVNGKIAISSGEGELKDTLATLQKTQKDLEKGIKGLKQAYETAQMLDKLLHQPLMTLPMIGDIYLDDLIAMPNEQLVGMGITTDSLIAMGMPITDPTLSPHDALVMVKTTAEQGLEQINQGLADQAAAMKEMGVELNSWEDLPEAIKAMNKALAKVKSGIAAIVDGQNQITEGKDKLNDGYTELTAGQITAILELSGVSAQLADAKIQLENGQTQLDNARDSALDQADVTKIFTVEMLGNLLTAQNFSMPAGYVQEGETQYLIRVGDEVHSLEDFENLILLDMGLEGIEPIYLKDVANVEIIDDSADSYARINGNPAIMLSIEKQTGYSTGNVTDNLLKKFKSLEKEEPALNIAVLMNQGVYIDIIVQSVVQNILVGAALAIIILIIFLKDIRSTFIIACSIPLSVVFAIVLMYFTGITLNIISLSGLALGIGMLVDNSIVVIENIYRLRKEGLTVKKSAVVGTSQVAGAIVASTLTTVCVFAPIIFAEGITRQLFVDMALTIAYTLGASLIVALTFVPMMSSVILKDGKEMKPGIFDKIQNAYKSIMPYVLKFKPLVLLLVIGLLLGSGFLAFSKGFSFMNMDMEMDQISLSLGARDDQYLTDDEIRELCDEATDIITEIDGVETVGVMIGGGGTMSLMSSGDGASFYVLLDEKTKRKSKDIVAEIEEKTSVLDCAVEVTTGSSDYSSMLGSGLTVQVKGRDLEKIEELTAQVAEVVRNTPGCIDVEDGLDNTTTTLNIHVDKEKAMEYKMTVAQVFQLVFARMAETQSKASISTDVKDFEVFVQNEEQDDTSIADIKGITFTWTNEDGDEEEIPISKIVTFEEGTSLSTIRRTAQTRYIAINASVAEGYNVTKVSSELKKELNKIEFPEGYSYSMTGEDETIMDAVKQLGLMLTLAVIFIYMVMVAQFQSLLSPFIIMFTIPLAFTGGFLSLFFTGNDVSVIAMVGFIMLAGIIVNNGIVMVDYINQLRRDGMDKKEAIAEAGKARLRPIMMTALTTIISMFPMALGIGEGSAMMQPMAIAMIGGLIYGTLLTLLVVPCIYDIFNRNKSMVEEEL